MSPSGLAFSPRDFGKCVGEVQGKIAQTTIAANAIKTVARMVSIRERGVDVTPVCETDLRKLLVIL